IFSEAKPLEWAFKVFTPFALPSLGVLSFLIMTEKDRRKAWVLNEEEKQHEWAKNFTSSGNAETFGIMTAFVWVLAIGAFIFLLILKLWVYSWIPFVIATAIMMLLLAHYMKMGNAETFSIMTAVVWVLAIGSFIFLLILKL